MKIWRILKIKQRILFNYPELANDVGIYSSISENKALAKTRKYILTTTKSAGAGEDIPGLKYSVVLAEPFRSEVLARQTLGRTRDPNTTYIELVDVGFKQISAYFNAKRQIFDKYASSTKVMFVDNLRMANIQEDVRVALGDRFKASLEFNCKGTEAVQFLEEKELPAVYFGNHSITDSTDNWFTLYSNTIIKWCILVLVRHLVWKYQWVGCGDIFHANYFLPGGQ